jgi:hypothetical protein
VGKVKAHAAGADGGHSGVVDAVWETKDGGYFRARLDLGSETAQTLYRVMQLNPSSVGVSYDYDIPRGGEKKAADGANDLLRVNLMEITLTPTPMLDSARVVGAKSRGQTLAQQLLVNLEATAAISRTRSPDVLYDFDGLVKRLDNDAVYQWDTLVREMSQKKNGTVPCCTTPLLKRCRPVAKSAAPFDFCESCGLITVIAQKSWSPARIGSEANRILKRITIIPVTTGAAARDLARVKRMADDLKKATLRREADDLVRFSRAPALPSKSELRREARELAAFVETTKPSTTGDFTARFGRAPAIRPDQLR